MGSTLGLERLLSALRKGERLFMGGSTGEVAPLTAALSEGRLPPLDLTTSFVPGVNVMPAHLPPGTRIANPFPLRTDATVDHLALTYSGYAAWVAGQTFDSCVVHVAPPVRGRRASLGTAAEFTLIAAARSARVFAVINPAIPDLPDAAHLDLDDAALVFEVASPLAQYSTGQINAEADAIAACIAGFIGDGAALQVGLGKVPDALMARLQGRRGLRLHSGMLSDSIRPLAEAGALDPDWMHTSCVHVGTAAHYDWLRGRRGFAVLGCDVTHSAAVLNRVNGLIAVNGALEVDLLGRANLEFAGSVRISSIGGAPDFARAAQRDPKGISIVGLPASVPKDGSSRIVAALAAPPSLTAHEVEVVVTEFGSADLRGTWGDARAESLIAIAHPDHRPGLAEAWARMASMG